MNNLRITVNVNPCDDIETGMINAVGELMKNINSHYSDTSRGEVDARNAQIRILTHCLKRADEAGYKK